MNQKKAKRKEEGQKPIDPQQIIKMLQNRLNMAHLKVGVLGLDLDTVQNEIQIRETQLNVFEAENKAQKVEIAKLKEQI